MKKNLSILAGALALCACNQDFTMPFEIDKPRLLATRLEPEGDVNRAWPKVGEKFNLRWLVARPDAPKSSVPKNQQISAAIAVCAGLELPTGGLFCAQEIPLPVENMVVNMDELVMPLSVPFDPREVAGASTVLLFGAFCSDAEIERIPGTKAGEDPTNQLYRCKKSDGSTEEALAFTSDLAIDFDDDNLTNQNPSFACDPTDKRGLCAKGSDQDDEERLGGPVVLVKPLADDARDGALKQTMLWDASGVDPKDLPFEDCATDLTFEDRQVALGDDEYTIRLRFDPSDRETYEFETEELSKKVIKKEREELLVATAATKGGGELDRYFTVIERDAANDEAEVEIGYKPPGKDSDDGKMVPKGGMLVRFYFVVRDQRGGTDFTTRELCLVREKAKR